MRHVSSRVARVVSSVEALDEAAVLRRRKRVEAFPSSARSTVDAVASIAPAVEDLAESFPALLFALATGYGSEASRQAALTAVLEGLPLKEVARRLELPIWLRKLPPAAFTAPLGNVPDDPQLVARLVSLIPTTPASAAAWLERVLIAHHTGRSDLTLWVAQQYRGPQPSPRSMNFLGVLAWAWFCDHPDSSRARQLLTTRWKPTVGAKRAVAEMRLWRERIALDICLGSGLQDTWIEEGAQAGLDFVALRTADDFIAEARQMDNCLDRYAGKLQGRPARVFSVRRDGRSIANLEIEPHEREPGHPVIAQLRGPHNRRAPLEVWQAAYAWLGSRPIRLADASLEIKRSRPAQARDQLVLWGPFLDVLPDHARLALEKHVLVKGATRRRAASSPTLSSPPSSS